MKSQQQQHICGKDEPSELTNKNYCWEYVRFLDNNKLHKTVIYLWCGRKLQEQTRHVSLKMMHTHSNEKCIVRVECRLDWHREKEYPGARYRPRVWPHPPSTSSSSSSSSLARPKWDTKHLSGGMLMSCWTWCSTASNQSWRNWSRANNEVPVYDDTITQVSN